MKSHKFEAGGGKATKEGSHWPDCLTLSMPRFYAWELLYSLIAQLRSSEVTVTFSNCGKLDYDVDED